MRKEFELRVALFVVVVCSFWIFIGMALSQCAKVPPNLSPPAVKAFHQHEVQKVLDLIRDIAQDGNTTVPPVVSLETARKVTLWHQSAISIVHAAGGSWQALVATSLEELLKNLSDADRAVLAPYVALARTILAEV